MPTRRQLTLFVPAPFAAPLEALRQGLDPVQHGLIAAHATLCREDELAAVSEADLQARLAAPTTGPLTLHFGLAQPFAGHGWLLPCVGGEPAFQALRRHMLGRADVAALQPHLTLAHPRNPQALGNTPAAAQAAPQALCIRFGTVSLIEQHAAQPWQVLAQWPLQALAPQPEGSSPHAAKA